MDCGHCLQIAKEGLGYRWQSTERHIFAEDDATSGLYIVRSGPPTIAQRGDSRLVSSPLAVFVSLKPLLPVDEQIFTPRVSHGLLHRSPADRSYPPAGQTSDK